MIPDHEGSKVADEAINTAAQIVMDAAKERGVLDSLQASRRAAQKEAGYTDEQMEETDVLLAFVALFPRYMDRLLVDGLDSPRVAPVLSMLLAVFYRAEKMLMASSDAKPKLHPNPREVES